MCIGNKHSRYEFIVAAGFTIQCGASGGQQTTEFCDWIVKGDRTMRWLRKLPAFYLNLLKAKRNLLYTRISPYRTVNTSYHGYKSQSVNDVQSKSRCLFRDSYKTLNTKLAPCTIFEC